MHDDILLTEMLNRLDITFELDEKTKAKYYGILQRSKAALCEYAGNPALVFEGTNRALLFDLCRYDANNCREEFETNFISEINTLRLREAFNCGKEKI